MVRSRRRCALRGRCSCSAADAAGRTACRRSQRCTHAQAPLRKLRRALRESIHWLRKPSRFPLRPRQCRLPGEPVVAFRRTVDRRLLVGSVGADPPARQGRMRRDCALHSPQWSQPVVARSSDEPAADRSWCTVGPLVGFAFGLVSPPTSFTLRERGRTDAHKNACTHTHTRRFRYSSEPSRRNRGRQCRHYSV
jgi:hypothetical protein